MNISQITKRKDIVSFLVTTLLVFLIVIGVIHIRRPNR